MKQLKSLKINLLPKKIVEEQKSSQFLHWSLTYGRYIIVFIEFIVLLAFFSRFRLDQEITNLHEAIEEKKVFIESFSDFEKQARILQHRIEKIKNLEKDHDLYTETLNVLEDVIPRGVVLNTLKISQHTVNFNAQAFSYQSYLDMVDSLKASDKFKNVRVNKINWAGKSRILAFEVSLQLNPNNF